MSIRCSESNLILQERYLDSIQGRIDQFNNALQSMWSNVLDDDLVKFIVQAGTELIKFIDNLGVVKTLIIGIGTYLIQKNFKGDLWGGLFNAQSIDEAKDRLKNLQAEIKELQGKEPSKRNNRKIERKKKQVADLDGHITDYDQKSKDLQKLRIEQEKAKKDLDDFNKSLLDKPDYPTDEDSAKQKELQDNYDAANNKVLEGEEALKQVENQAKKTGTAGLNAGDKLKTGFVAGAKAVGTFAKQVAESMLTMYAITTVMDLLGKLWTGLNEWGKGINESPEEAREKFEELNQELSSAQSELRSLESELDKTTDRIDELMSMGTLSFVEQEELNNLQKQTKELEAQIELAKTLEETLKSAAGLAAINASQKTLSQTSFYSDKSKSEREAEAKENGSTWGSAAGMALGLAISFIPGVNIAAPVLMGAGALGGNLLGGAIGGSRASSKYDSEKTAEDVISNMRHEREALEKARDEAYKAYANADPNDTKQYKQLKSQWEDAQAKLGEFDGTMAQYVGQMQQYLNSIDPDKLTNPADKEYYQQMQTWVDTYAVMMGGSDAKANLIARIFGDEASEELKEIKKRMEEAAEAGEEISLADAFNGDEEAYNAFKTRLYNIGLTVYETEQYFKDQKKAADEAINSIETYDAIKQIQKLTGGVNDLKNAFKELHEEGLVSADTLLGLEEKFGDIDGWKEFFEIVSSGTATMEEAQEAAKTLAENYVDQILSSGVLSQKEYITAISHLQSLGITNAKDFLDAKLKKNMAMDIAQRVKNGTSQSDAIKAVEEEYGIKLDGENDRLLVEKAITAEKKKQEALDKKSAQTTYDDAVNAKGIAEEKLGAARSELSKIQNVKDLKDVATHVKGGPTLGDRWSYNGQTYWSDYYVVLSDGTVMYKKDYNDLLAEAQAKVHSAETANNSIQIPAKVTEIDVTNANNAATEAENELQAELDKHGLTLEINLIDKNELIDEAQSIYDTLANAAKEYGESGYVSVDTLQSILQLEPKYIALLYDENGQLNLNKDSLYQLTVARVTDMGIQQAQSVIETARTALLDGNIEKLKQLTEVTYGQADANWSLVTSNLALLKTEMEDANVDDSIYQGIEDQVFAIQNLTNTTIANIGNTISSSGNTAAAEVEDAFQSLMDYYDNRISANQAKYDQIQNDIDFLEAQGKMADANYYKDQIALLTEGEESKEAFLEAKLQGAADRLRELEAAGKEGSDEWWEAAQIYNDTLSELDDVRDMVLDLQDAIGNLEWSKFEELNSRLDDLAGKLETIRDLIAPDGEEDWFDDEGNWTEKGVAVLGSYVQSLEYYRNGLNEASKALETFQSKEYNKANAKWFADNYGIHSEQEYYDYLQKLTDEQYNYASSVSDTEQDIAGMWESQVDAVEEYFGTLIESYQDYIENVKEALDAERDLYDFKKNVQKQSKDIAALERRIASLSGSTNASDVAERRKLEAELYDSRESLNDTYYDHSKQSQQEALEAESIAYEETMNRFVENLRTNLDLALQDMDTFIQGVTSAVTVNAPTILDTYNSLGIALDSAIVDPWQSAIDAMGEDGYSGEEGLGLMNSWVAEGGVFSTFSTKATDYLTSVWDDANVDPGDAFATAVSNKVNGIVTSIQKNVETAKGYLQDLYDVQDTSVYTGGGGGGGGYVPQGSPQPAYSKDVENLQKILNKFFGTNITANGIFDDTTRAAVKKMQKKIGVLNNGVYNKQTYEALMAYLNKQPVGSWFRQVGFGIPGPMPQYAKGTTGTPRDEWAITDEPKFGDELVLVPGKDGNLSFVRKGTGIVPADMTQKLFELAQIPTSDLMNKNLTAIVPNITKNDFKNEFNFESLVHVDTVDSDTLPKLEQMVDKKIDDFSKALNYSLKRFAR